MGTLIYVSDSDFHKKKLKHLFYNIPYFLKNNNINNVSLFFKVNGKYYDNIEDKHVYYYLMKKDIAAP